MERAFIQEYIKSDQMPLMVYGFRSKKLPDGSWLSHPTGEYSLGKIIGPLPDGRGQFDRLPVTGAAVQRGFSGAGIYDPDQDTIVGMIVEADKEKTKKLAQFIDVPSLRKALGTAGSDISPLMKTYLSCITTDADAFSVHVKRTVVQQNEDARSQPASNATPEPIDKACSTIYGRARPD